MTRNAAAAVARAWVVLLQAAWVAFGLAMPLMLGPELGLAGGAGALVVGLVAALVVALASRYAGVASGTRTGLPSRAAAAGPRLSSRIPDPIRHPLCPRAPGLV